MLLNSNHYYKHTNIYEHNFSYFLYTLIALIIIVMLLFKSTQNVEIGFILLIIDAESDESIEACAWPPWVHQPHGRGLEHTPVWAGCVVKLLKFHQGFMLDQTIASHTCFGGHVDVNC